MKTNAIIYIKIKLSLNRDSPLACCDLTFGKVTVTLLLLYKNTILEVTSYNANSYAGKIYTQSCNFKIQLS